LISEEIIPALSDMNCRFCKNALTHEFVDLGSSPPSNSFLSKEQLNEPEVYYPLRVFVCDSCFLVQIDEYKKANEIFDQNYLYFSSFSQSWLEHSRRYVESMCERFGYDPGSQVIEIASNDGYLLQYFKERDVPVFGIEPTLSTATVARDKGIETITEFFGVQFAAQLASQGRQADLLLGNNVLAHVPDINDFVAGLAIALKPGGVVTMEFPHLMRLVENNQFDTIYHEHYSYLSFYTVSQIFGSHGLEMFDVEELPTHGGSLRIYAKHKGDQTHETTERVKVLLSQEKDVGLQTLDYYLGFQSKVEKIKYDLLSFLIEQKRAGKLVAAYGAAAKGNTLLNYGGIKKSLIDFVVDASHHKQGKFLPGSHIPIVDESVLRAACPDHILILPWNLKSEIAKQLSYIHDWGGKFVTLIPGLEVT
jgi:2-polyprenyl-3-methyl-5-hydroxy-6-metoxy-1,4-benzoquinol methylase